MSRLPVRLRVTLAFAGVMVIVLGATGLFLYLRLGTQLNHTIDRNLQTRAEQLAALIRVSDHGLGEPARSVLRGERENYAQVLTPSGRLFDPKAQSHHPPVLDPAELRESRSDGAVLERADLPGFAPEQTRLFVKPIRFEGSRLLIVETASLKDRNGTLGSMATLLLIGGPIALLLASIAAYFMAGAALRPVDAMRRRAAEISAAEADQRLPVPPAQDELHRLGETLNEMLDRLHAAVERERAFVDDASHELRTPLALHRTELELALRHGGSVEELRAAIGSAIDETVRLTDLAEDLLILARAEKDALAIDAETVPVAELFATVREQEQGEADSLGRSLLVGEPDGNWLAIEGDRVRLERALGNLVDNALRHGRGPVELSARDGQSGVELHVTDSGPGFPPDFLPHAFERFRRADAARADGGGSGLGMAIVDAIARAHRGRAEARNAPGGGADVWIEIPRAR